MSRENCIWCLCCLLFITKWLSLDSSAETTSWIFKKLFNFSFLDGLQRLVCLLMVYSYFIMIIDHRPANKSIFYNNSCSSTKVFIFLLNGASINFFFWINFLFFSLRLLTLFLLFFLRIFYLSTLFLSVLTLEHWIFRHLLANLFPSFWLFLVLFRMLWMLVIVNKPYHVEHASQMTIWRSISMETFLVSSMNESDLGHTLSE